MGSSIDPPEAWPKARAALLEVVRSVVLLVPLACGSASGRPVEADLELTLAPGPSAPGADAPLRLEPRLTNVGSERLWVVSHYDTGLGPHFDPFHFQIEGTDGSRRSVRPVSPRTAAVRIGCSLDPGQSLVHDIDLRAWPGGDLPAGEYEITAAYEVRPDASPLHAWGVVDERGRCDRGPSSPDAGSARPVWTGRVEAPAIRLEVAPRGR